MAKRTRDADLGQDPTCLACLGSTEEAEDDGAAEIGAQSCLGCGKRLHVECAELWRTRSPRPGCPHCRRAWPVPANSTAAAERNALTINELVMVMREFIRLAAADQRGDARTQEPIVRLEQMHEAPVDFNLQDWNPEAYSRMAQMVRGRATGPRLRMPLAPAAPPPTSPRSRHAMVTRSHTQ